MSNFSGMNVLAGAGDNDIWLMNGTDIEVDTKAGQTNVRVTSGAQFSGFLDGMSDVIDAGDGTAGMITATLQSGSHSFLLNNEFTELMVDPNFSNNFTVIQDMAARTAPLLINLGADLSNEIMTSDSTGFHLFSTDGTLQRIDYIASSSTSSSESRIYIEGAVPNTLQPITVSADLLIQAMANVGSPGVATTNFDGAKVNGYSMLSLVSYAQSHYPSI